MVAVHSFLFPAMDESLKLWFAVIGTPYLGYIKISPSRNFDDLREMTIKELGITGYIKLWKVRQVLYYYNQVPGLGVLDEIGPRSQVTAHLAGVRI